VLKAAGYQTVPRQQSVVTRRFGFEQASTPTTTVRGRDYPGDEISRAALRWLATVPPGQPFFLYLHFLDSHRPYPALPMQVIDANQERVAADPQRELSKYAKQELRALVQVEGTDPLTAALVEPYALEMAYERGVEDFDRAPRSSSADSPRAATIAPS
jgi:hypothetical protein